jgi:hypothetical protein
MVKTPQNKFNTLLKSNPKSGHTWICYGQGTILSVLFKEGNHTSPTAHNVAVAHYGENCVITPYIGIAGDEEFVSA